ncbi:hypothetical protein BKA62DRAFT_614545 [Auriculariales sp. MPI-PUGE-AT-0066]|nr:hypothetical protein BKA62DRAFT_614545 [Auriculariales sp. MPI-PUGE-AT-0066]
MHDALALDDILHAIVPYLNLKDVLAFAGVCKGWYTVAISQTMQEKVVTVDQLLRLIPSHLILQHKPLTLAKNGSYHPEIFERMCLMAPRIRNLLLRFWPAIEYRVFDLLATHVGSAFRSPGLERIDWRILAQSHVRMLIELLSPSVHTIKVLFPNTEPNFPVAELLDSIRTRSPNIRTLAVSILYPSHLFMDAFVSCARSLNLRRAVLQFNMASNLLLVLASLPNLQELDCEVHADLAIFEQAQSSHLPPHSFPALRRLRVNGYHSAWVSILASVARPSLLEYLRVNMNDGLEWTPSAAFALIGISTPQLKTLVLRCKIGVRNTDRHDVDHGLVCSPPVGLLQCTLLEYVHIVYQYALAWTDADMSKIAAILPCIRILRLNGYPTFSAQEPNCTTKSLGIFAKHCPRLVELELFMCVTPPDTSAVVEQTEMRYLDFGKSAFQPGVDPFSLAHYILETFPRLVELRSAEPDDYPSGSAQPHIPLALATARLQSAHWDDVRGHYKQLRGGQQEHAIWDISGRAEVKSLPDDRTEFDTPFP